MAKKILTWADIQASENAPPITLPTGHTDKRCPSAETVLDTCNDVECYSGNELITTKQLTSGVKFDISYMIRIYSVALSVTDRKYTTSDVCSATAQTVIDGVPTLNDLVGSSDLYKSGHYYYIGTNIDSKLIRLYPSSVIDAVVTKGTGSVSLSVSQKSEGSGAYLIHDYTDDSYTIKVDSPTNYYFLNYDVTATYFDLDGNIIDSTTWPLHLFTNYQGHCM